MKKSIVSMALALLLIVGLIPTKVYAGVETGSCGQEVSYVLLEDGVLKIYGRGAMTDFSYGGMDLENANPFIFFRSRIKKVIVSEGVFAIGSYAFTNCKNLTSVEIPESLIRVGANAFKGCENLEGIYLGDKNVMEKYVKKEELTSKVAIVDDGYSGIGNTYNLYSDGRLVITGVGGVSKDFSYQNFETYYTPIKEIILGDGINGITGLGFAECKIKAITIPETLKRVGPAVFLNCYPVGVITLHGNVKLEDIEIGGENKIFDTWTVITEDHSYTKNWEGTYTCDVCGKVVEELPKAIDDGAKAPEAAVTPEKAKPVNNNQAVTDDNGNKVTTKDTGIAKIVSVKKSTSKTVAVKSVSMVDDVEYVVAEIGAEAFKSTKASALNIELTLNKIAIDKNAFKGSKIKKVVVTLTDNATKAQKKAVVKAFKNAGIKKKNIMVL